MARECQRDGKCIHGRGRIPKPYGQFSGKDVVFGKVQGASKGENAMENVKVVFDPLYSLRDDDRNRQDVVEYLEEENKYTEEATQHFHKEIDWFYEEMLRHVKETDQSVPYCHGSYLYYTRTEQGKAYPIYCRKEGDVERVYLDLNKIAASASYCKIGVVSMSPDHGIVAFSLDVAGYEVYTVYFYDIENATYLDDKIPNTTGPITWGADNKTVYYCMYDDVQHRPYRFYRHEMGKTCETDTLLLGEDDETCGISFGKTVSGRFIICSIDSFESSEVYTIDLNETDPKLCIVHPREPKLRYAVDHSGDYFYIVTNADGAINQKLVRTEIAKPGKANWQNIADYDENISIEDTLCLKDNIVVEGRQGGFSGLWVVNESKLELEKVSCFPDQISNVYIGINREYETSKARVVYESMVTPVTNYDLDVSNMSIEVIHQRNVLNYDSTKFECKQLYAPGHDGVQIPISIVYKKKFFDENTPVPMCLEAYGAYGSCCDPVFVASDLPLLERGVCIAYAHVRGGGELGRTWYDNGGKFLNKKNTFYDFISCARHLIDEGITSPEKLAITGTCIGGLTMGVALNMAPELFKCCIMAAPCLDTLNTLAEPTTEWEELGNPNEEPYFDYIQSYDPCNNIGQKDYPAILLTVGYHDLRVGYWEAVKYAAKLRDMKTNDSEVLLHINMDSGHDIGANRYKYLREKAFQFAFISDQLNLSKQ
eukprot:CAMPEP_0203749022 /NCGR_PEP_ID=MMETSP0098-20131031/3725_1 /ASSEMBLY_ACC=CAM_ASM_000208 /TAXON_ID=96639 /ORGANISM=" , Strain NY0313808BC1" /LENGTH=709 /DNA_ID=CAMNT_0050637951 /DNA_START=1683 /DNA_END=3812 /DNA_ORIENTATION=-